MKTGWFIPSCFSNCRLFPLVMAGMVAVGLNSGCGGQRTGESKRSQVSRLEQANPRPVPDAEQVDGDDPFTRPPPPLPSSRQLNQFDEVAPPAKSLFSSRLRLRPNPIRRVPLVAVAEFETFAPAKVRMRVSDGQRSWEQDWDRSPATEHAVVVLGLRPNRRHEIQMIVRDVATGKTETSPSLIFETGRLPIDFPPLRTTKSIPEKMEPGVTLFAANIWREGAGLLDYGYMIAVDAAGEVVWYCHTDDRTADIRRTSTGTLLYQQGSYRYAYEMDLLGRDLRRWVATNLTEQPDSRSIPVAVDTMHHDLVETSSGTLLTLATELHHFERYPSSESDPDAPWGPAPVVCDQIVEFDAESGSIVDQLHLVDILDRKRFGYMALTGFWNDKYRPKVGGPVRDWSHANALVPVPNENACLVSLRHLDCILKVDRESQQIVWILGDPAGWSEPWQSLCLQPIGELEWPYHQHSPQFTPTGTVLLYDNGNFRGLPFKEKVPAPKNRSRVVEYRVDEQAKTVEQVFVYDGGPTESFYSPFYCEADWLPETANLLVTDGGHIELEDGTPADKVPGDRQWARVFEITRDSTPVKVFEVECRSPPSTGLGWSIYRAQRYKNLYDGFKLDVPGKEETGNLFPREPHKSRQFPELKAAQ